MLRALVLTFCFPVVGLDTSFQPVEPLVNVHLWQKARLNLAYSHFRCHCSTWTISWLQPILLETALEIAVLSFWATIFQLLALLHAVNLWNYLHIVPVGINIWKHLTCCTHVLYFLRVNTSCSYQPFFSQNCIRLHLEYKLILPNKILVVGPSSAGTARCCMLADSATS